LAAGFWLLARGFWLLAAGGGVVARTRESMKVKNGSVGDAAIACGDRE